MHDFLLRRTLAQCAFGMAADAIRTLRDMGHGHGDQLLGLARQCFVGEDTLAERRAVTADPAAEFASRSTIGTRVPRPLAMLCQRSCELIV